MKLTPESLSAHLAQQLARVYLISGDEPLLCAEAADGIRERARAAGFTEREVHFLERATDWDDVRASAGNLSLFGARRLVEIRIPSGRPGTAGSATLLRLLEVDDPDTLYLVLGPRLDRDAQNSAWVKAIESRGVWVQVWPVAAGKLVSWLRARARRSNLQISDDALALLAERTEGNLLAADQELQKLHLAHAGPVDAQTILAGVADSARFDAFQLGDAVLSGETERALRMLAGLRAEGVEATLVLWSLTKALRDLWGTQSGATSGQRAWGRQAAALEKGARRASRLSFPELTERAIRADRLIKGREAGNPWDELALLAAELCGRRPLPPARFVLK